jgi:GntR family transcriptional regulator/MocR family aminotransferase
MARTRTSWAGELLVPLVRESPAPLHQQLEVALREAVRSGRLASDSALPSTRALADQLDISRGVVVEAYEQLVAEGYLSSQPGGVTRVTAAAAVAPPRREIVATRPPRRFDFAYGRPDVSEFPRQAWLRCLKRVLNEMPAERMSYLDGRGTPEAREALAAYLNRVRATAADPESIVITNGFAQAMALVARVLKQGGATRLAVEDPGQRDVIRTAGEVGLEVVPVPVDDGGLVVEALERSGADAVLVTPAHHFPTGAVLPAERRKAIEQWASRGTHLIIEDDYDAEYRYDREPIGALQGLAPEQVVYAGSASKTLAPGLRLGWLLVPPRLVGPLATAKEASDRGSASIEQLAFADFLARGDFDRHLRRMRPVYRARRDALLAAIGAQMPGLRPVGASAGLHVLAWLPPGVDEAAIVATAAAEGIAIDGLTPYRQASRGPGGLVFGYGAITEAQIPEGVAAVARIVAAA